MKDFEFDGNRNMNGEENKEVNNGYTPADTSAADTSAADTSAAGNTPAENAPAENEKREEAPAQQAQPGQAFYNNAQPEQTASRQEQPRPMQENPYFRGYAQPSDNRNYYGTQPQQPLNAQPQQNQPLNAQQNAQPNPYWREYPYGNQQDPNRSRPNPYANQPQNNQPLNNQPQNNQNGYNQPLNNQQYQQNGYQPHYSAPRHDDGQISYTPSYKKEKKKKEKKPFTRGAAAVLCCLMLVLSVGAGFGGAMLASSINQDNGAPASGSVQNSLPNSANNSVVIYRDTESVTTSTGAANGENLSFSQVAAMVKDSVVEIVTEFNNQSMWYQYVTQGAGSGVIISEDGYIITNAHVITNESTGGIADNILVRLTDSTEYTAETIGYDADADIAILKIDATGLIPAQCGNSDNLAVGEELVVVGNPLGELGGTVTNGIVSATQREIQMGGVTMSLIQTNAAVNPGNSGGGMFNMKGQLVGIVNAKSTGSGIEGLGFAIPINYALDISEQLLEYGYVRGKTMIGVTFQDVSGSNYFFYYNIKAGVYVAELTEGYNDDVLVVGDRIIAVNGKEISSSEDIKAAVTACSVGDKIKFQLYRDDKLMEVEVTCYEKVPDTNKDVQFEEGTTEGRSGSAGVQPSGSIEEFFFGGK